MRLNLKLSSTRGAVILLLFIMMPLFSDTILIPEDHSTIQSGINAATNGDTVLVAAGIYNENISFKGKEILLTSYFMLEHDLQQVNETIINGSSYADPDSASTVTFCSNETGYSILQGFTITGGNGTTWIDPQIPNYTWHSGGGVFIYYASPSIKNNIITSNTVDNNGSYDGASGGGLLCFRGNPLICNNTFSSNQADYGAGLVVDYSGALIANNLITYNSGGEQYGGGGIYCIGTDTEPILIFNNVVYGNYSMTTGGAIQLWTSNVTAKNNILWGNSQNSGGSINGNSINISYSVIEDNFTGEGNITDDPQIIDFTTYQLSASSPCIDAGDPSAEYNDPEDPANPGQAIYPSYGTVRNDIGAYGGPYSAMWEMTSVEGSMIDLEHLPFSGLKAYPNPFNPSTKISFSLTTEDTEGTELFIYNLKGQKVRRYTFPCFTDQFGTQDDNGVKYSVRWDGKDENGHQVTSGIYLYTLSLSGHSQTKKMILLK
ncbi:T9SS type A sorting domain-containing protein [Candidatus Cloacimonadota bacterium]